MRSEQVEPMTEEEFRHIMDGLIEKGIVNIGRTERGELGFVVTAFGMEALKQAERVQ